MRTFTLGEGHSHSEINLAKVTQLVNGQARVYSRGSPVEQKEVNVILPQHPPKEYISFKTYSIPLREIQKALGK